MSRGGVGESVCNPGDPAIQNCHGVIKNDLTEISSPKKNAFQLNENISKSHMLKKLLREYEIINLFTCVRQFW